MKYYRVPANMDNKKIYKTINNKKIYSGLFYIANELVTENECKKYGYNIDYLIPVEIKKTNTYKFFGARFEK